METSTDLAGAPRPAALTVDSLSGCDSLFVLVVVPFLVVDRPRKNEDEGESGRSLGCGQRPPCVFLEHGKGKPVPMQTYTLLSMALEAFPGTVD